MCSKSWQLMFYFRVGSGCYSVFSTWDGDGCGVTYTVRTRLWCGIWPVVEVKTEKWQQYPAKIWYCPTGFSFYSKGHNILYSAKSASWNSHSRKNTSWQNKCFADFIIFYTNFLCTEIGLLSNVCMQKGKILWKMWHSKWINIVAQQFLSVFYIGGNPLWHVSDNGIISYEGSYCMRALLFAAVYNGVH